MCYQYFAVCRDVYLLEQEVRGADESQKHKIEREKAEVSFIV